MQAHRLGARGSARFAYRAACGRSAVQDLNSAASDASRCWMTQGYGRWDDVSCKDGQALRIALPGRAPTRAACIALADHRGPSSFVIQSRALITTT